MVPGRISLFLCTAILTLSVTTLCGVCRADTVVYSFDDVEGWPGDDTLNGVHGGIDFGTNVWGVDQQYGDLSYCGWLRGSPPGSFDLPAGSVLVSVVVWNTDYTIQDGVNPGVSGGFCDTPTKVETGWTLSAPHVTITLSGGAIDDVEFGPGRAATVVYSFDDVEGWPGDDALNGVHGGIDFGTNVWGVDQQYGDLSYCGWLRGFPPGSFDLPAGSVLVSVVVWNTNYTIQDGVNPDVSGGFCDTPTKVETGWTLSAPHVVITLSGGAIDDVEYGHGLQTLTMTDFSVSDQATGNTLLTTSATVNVAISATSSGETGIAAYMVTESETQPAADSPNWVPSTDTTYAASHTYSGPGGTMTLYGWVKDSAGSIVGKSDSILYYATPPVVTSATGPYSSTATAAVVRWTTDIPSFGRALWREAGAFEWIAGNLDTQPVTSHMGILTGLVQWMDYEFKFENSGAESAAGTFIHTGAVPELPKWGMTAVAASANAANRSYVIDGDARSVFAWQPTMWENPVTCAWIRIDLGARCRVLHFGHKSYQTYASMKDFWLYVTDGTSENRDDWGSPARTGQFSPNGLRSDWDCLGEGRYAILYGNGWDWGIAMDELWFYGTNLDPIISTFTVADATSGSTSLSNSATVAVALEAVEGENPIAGYMITETEDAPDSSDEGWSGTSPDSYTITGEDGPITLYAWVKDSANAVTRGPVRTIILNTAAPVLSGVGAFWQSATTAIVGWTTDIEAVGRVLYREAGEEDWYYESPLESTPGISHRVMMTDLVADWDYEFAVESNEVLSATFTYTHTGSLSEIPKPAAGGVMTASASITLGDYLPAYAIDSTIGSTFWRAFWADEEPPGSKAWLRIDLKSAYRIQIAGIKNQGVNGGFRSLQIFVTDSADAPRGILPPTFNPPAEWGNVLASGMLPGETANRVDFDLLGVGRYVIILGDAQLSTISVDEVWLYGANLDPVVTAFGISDQSSGSATLTDSTTVNVDITAVEGGNPIGGYMITEEDWMPEPGEPGWSATAPVSYTFSATEESDITLYAWVKDTEGNVTGKSATIHYQPPAPVVILSQEMYGQTATAAVLLWTTDVACIGRAYVRAQGDPDWIVGPLDSAPTTRHFRVIPDLAQGVAYEVQVENNEQLGPIVSYTHENVCPEIPKPAAGGSMTADASVTSGGQLPAYTIDSLAIGSDSLYWLAFWADEKPPGSKAWLRIDLKSPYQVQRVGIKNQKFGSGFRNIQIFVTDSDAAPAGVLPPTFNPPFDWGDVLASGTLPGDTTTRVDFDLFGVGRYVIILGDAQL